MHILGGHPCDNGGLHMAVQRAVNAGMSAIQIFTAIPKFYGDKSTINPDRVKRFREALSQTSIRPEHVMVHGAYVLNTASSNAEQWSRAAGGLIKEMERSTTLGVGLICFHPGSTLGADMDESLARVAEAMTRALESAPDSPVRLLVENTAGAGRTVGRTAAEVAGILSRIPGPLRRRAGYGLDTCHLYASGYDIAASEERLRSILDQFEDAVGERPAFFHLNDSDGALGSNRDRHALIGKGQIGVDAFRWLLEDERSQDVPLILETPQALPEVGRDDPSPDSFDVEMMSLLRQLLPARR
jgi:deoxyribonuclease-4